MKFATPNATDYLLQGPRSTINNELMVLNATLNKWQHFENSLLIGLRVYLEFQWIDYQRWNVRSWFSNWQCCLFSCSLHLHLISIFLCMSSALFNILLITHWVSFSCQSFTIVWDTQDWSCFVTMSKIEFCWSPYQHFPRTFAEYVLKTQKRMLNCCDRDFEIKHLACFHAFQKYCSLRGPKGSDAASTKEHEIRAFTDALQRLREKARDWQLSAANRTERYMRVQRYISQPLTGCSAFWGSLYQWLSPSGSFSWSCFGILSAGLFWLYQHRFSRINLSQKEF